MAASREKVPAMLDTIDASTENAKGGGTFRPPYLRVFATFARNSLIRNLMFRTNFIVEGVTSLVWMAMNLGFYILVFQYTTAIGDWSRDAFFVFLATTLIVNSLVQTFFMLNLDEFSELIRTGDLDFALTKPIDTQFLISLRKVEWAALGNLAFGLGLLFYALAGPAAWPSPVACLLYCVYVVAGVLILYTLSLSMAAASVWMGRNTNLYDFWFYITNFSRYPMEIYQGRLGEALRWTFTFAVPLLLAVNIPARFLARSLDRDAAWLAVYTIFATAGCLFVSRWLFSRALASYRSASS